MRRSCSSTQNCYIHGLAMFLPFFAGSLPRSLASSGRSKQTVPKPTSFARDLRSSETFNHQRASTLSQGTSGVSTAIRSSSLQTMAQSPPRLRALSRRLSFDTRVHDMDARFDAFAHYHIHDVSCAPWDQTVLEKNSR